MAEEFVELGFEGLDRFTNRYFDQTYDHLPNLPRLGRKKSERRRRQLPSGASPQHSDKGYNSAQTSVEDAYIKPEMYGARGQDYARDRGYYEADDYGRDERYYRTDDYGRDQRYHEGDEYGRDRRYYEGDRVDYVNRAPGPGFRIPREQAEEPGGWSTQQYVQAGQRAGGRPEPQRRGSSWSPPRSDRRGRSESGRSGSRTKSGSQSRADDAKRRFVATIGGALVGGLAGNRAGKGRQYDTAATVAGAILGGVGAREAADHWDKARQKKKEGRGDDGNGEGRRGEKWHDGRQRQRQDQDDGRR